ncbi:28S ribosomal protein S17, mitochondrial [Coccinella septempunctata]|uniref:28S ribosomal protein S17, mitochondrial n=1 Tax=Coccinella septempunctata TaxID=41139 RepID=UPI001D05ED1C|nr:28S ribosomal protein S17, mitochondrial [Coccinella septempunctata]
MALKAATKVSMLLGQCVPCIKQNASKFKIKRLELDTNLNMYFPKVEYIYAHDPEKKCKTGDVVLIQQLPERMTRLITHEVKDIIYPFGDITDPLSGKKCVAGKFRDHIDAVNKVYGESDSRFEYEKAPERGWQEDKKDFSHAETYIKYHETGEDQPYGY